MKAAKGRPSPSGKGVFDRFQSGASADCDIFLSAGTLIQNLPDTTALKAILMINEIVTRLGRNFWYYGGKIIAEWI